MDEWESGDIVQHLAKCTFFNRDAIDFIEHQEFSKNDFLFMDIPYEIYESVYVEHPFTPSHHRRLANLLRRVNANWLLFAPNDRRLESMYKATGKVNISHFDQGFNAKHTNRRNNPRDVMVIKNY